MKYIVTYKAKFFSSISQKEETACGVTFAKNFAAAAKKIEDYYGEELITVEITLTEASSILELPEDVVQKVAEGEYY